MFPKNVGNQKIQKKTLKVNIYKQRKKRKKKRNDRTRF